MTNTNFTFGPKNDNVFSEFLRGATNVSSEFEIRFGSYTYDRERKQFHFHSEVDVDFYMRLKKSMNQQSTNSNISKKIVHTEEEIVPHPNGKGTVKKIKNGSDISYLYKHSIRKYNIVDYELRFSLASERIAQENDVVQLFQNSTSQIVTRSKLRTRYQLSFGWLDITEVKQNQKPAHFEVELEIKNSLNVGEIMSFIRFILQTRQNNFYLTPYFEKRNIVNEYRNLVNAFYFVGAQPETLHKDQISKLYKESYSVTDKADGERAFLFITADKKTYIMDSNIQKISKTDIVSPVHYSCLIDGELMIENNSYVFKAFDILCIDGQDIRGDTRYKLDQRLESLEKIVKTMCSSSLYKIMMKEFYFTNVFLGAKIILDKVEKEGLPNDGLIFTPMNEPYPTSKKWSNLLKWKPASQNSIDFYAVNVENDIWNLYVQHPVEVAPESRKAPSTECVLFDIQKLFGKEDNTAQNTYVTRFDPTTIDPSTGEPYQSGTVIEFKWDNVMQCFVPMRTRWDKTVNPRKHGNFSKVAYDIWYSIHNPIDKGFLLKFSNNDNNDVHFEKMRKFHNKVKEYLYNKYCKNTLAVLELCSGKGGDLYKWYHNNVKTVHGYDICDKSVEESKRRLVQLESRVGKLDYRFFKLDLTDPEAGHLIKANANGNFSSKQGYDAICCQFGIHYFFQSQNSFQNVMDIITENIKDEGYLVFTFMDNTQISKLMGGHTTVSKQVGKETVYLLEKDPLSSESLFGNSVSIVLNGNNYLGSGSKEYIINFAEFVSTMKSMGFECVETQLFEEYYHKNNHDIQLSDVEMDISFLNRYIVFARNSKRNTTKNESSVTVKVNSVTTTSKQSCDIIDLHHNNFSAQKVTDVYDIITTLNCVKYRYCKHDIQNTEITSFKDIQNFFDKFVPEFRCSYIEDPYSHSKWMSLNTVGDDCVYFTDCVLTIDKKNENGEEETLEYINWYIILHKNKLFFDPHLLDNTANVLEVDERSECPIEKVKTEYITLKESGKITIKLLKDLLKELGEKTSGKKEELQNRLEMKVGWKN